MLRAGILNSRVPSVTVGCNILFLFITILLFAIEPAYLFPLRRVYHMGGLRKMQLQILRLIISLNRIQIRPLGQILQQDLVNLDVFLWPKQYAVAAQRRRS